MITPNAPDAPLFRDTVQGLRRGDFSRLEPIFDEDGRIVEWYRSSIAWLPGKATGSSHQQGHQTRADTSPTS